jgi:uncharacterized membrane protein
MPGFDSQSDCIPVRSLAGDKRERSLRTFTHLSYALLALSWFTGGITAVVAVMIAYVKRDDAVGTLYRSHFDWQIRTFWIVLAGSLLAFASMVIIIGFVVMAAVTLWALYRIIKGWLRLNDDKPMPGRVRARSTAV